MKNLVGYIKDNVCNTFWGDRLINFIRIHAIDEKLYQAMEWHSFRKTKKNPTESMICSKKFFSDNRDKIKDNCHMLADERSIQTYKKACLYRCTHNMDKAPAYNRYTYFPREIVERLTGKEVFVDGGAFVGDTAKRFAKIVHGRYSQIICFEPDIYNYKMLGMLKLRKIDKNLGLWSSKTELYFFNNSSVGSKVISQNSLNKENTIIIKVDSIDNISECHDATFIKLDVEGSEMEALKGAYETIKRNHPKLAVCLYHSNEDMIRIIPYIHENFPWYKLYVYHHSRYDVETVLYAVENEDD